MPPPPRASAERARTETDSTGTKTLRCRSANFYPVEFLVRRIGGDAVQVADMTPPVTEPHDLVLDGKTVADLQAATWLSTSAPVSSPTWRRLQHRLLVPCAWPTC
jgi:hypothetical protein